MVGPVEFLIIGLMVLFLIMIFIVVGVAIRYVLAYLRNQAPDTRRRVNCPYCAELILPEAKICRFCGRSVAGNLRADN
jgi:hypothetical protein